MQTSQEINELAKALASVELKNPQKTKTVQVKSERTGGKFSYSYATLADVIDAVRKPLRDAGICYVQVLTQTPEGKTVLTTRLIHTSGQWIESTYPIPSNLSNQDQGGAITYARRYSLSAITGIAAEDDDDAEGADSAAQKEKDAEASQAAEDLKKKVDAARLAGKHKSAYDGHVLKPGEDPKPADEKPADKKAAELQAKIDKEAKAEKTEAMDGIDKRLVALMTIAKIEPSALQAYIGKVGHFSADTPVRELPKDYIDKVVDPANWKKISASILK